MPVNLFSIYSTKENRVTSSLLAVLRALSLDRIDRILGALLEQSEFQLIRMTDQPARGGNSIPDAEISASCEILFETKRELNAVGEDQIRRHLQQLDQTRSNAYLLVLTPDDARPSGLARWSDDEHVVWASFERLGQAIDEILADTAEVVSEREAFLLRELQAMLSNEGLIGSGWDTVVVPARHAWTEYLACGAYICQNHRSIRPVGHVAFYKDNRIEALIPKVIAVCDDVELALGQHGEPLGEIIEWYVRKQPDSQGKRKVFVLSKHDDPRTVRLKHPIDNDLLSTNGTRTAFTQNQRYVRLTDLKAARTTSQLLDTPQ